MQKKPHRWTRRALLRQSMELQQMMRGGKMQKLYSQRLSEELLRTRLLRGARGITRSFRELRQAALELALGFKELGKVAATIAGEDVEE